MKWTTSELISLEQSRRFESVFPEEYAKYQRLVQSIEYFERYCYSKALAVYKESEVRGQEASLAYIKYAQFGMAGRLVITITNTNSEEYVTLIGAIEGVQRLGLHAIDGTLMSAIELIDMVRTVWYVMMFEDNKELTIG